MKNGDDVTWSWGQSKAKGKIAEPFTENVTRTIKGKKITRNASKAERAYLIEQKDGDKVLKSASEFEKGEQGAGRQPAPLLPYPVMPGRRSPWSAAQSSAIS